jgi:pimeloyl-ACP methyl ester carboxylesterase
MICQILTLRDNSIEMNKQRWIFLRGLTRAAFHWGDFPQIFRDAHPDWEVEFLEIPGNGILNHRDTPIDPVTVIKEISEQSQFIKEGKSFHLCGISLGGMIALKWAELYPEQVESVAIINCSLSQYSPFYQRLSPKLYRKIVTTLLSRGVLNKEQIILNITSNRPERYDHYLESFTEFSKNHKVQRKNFFRQLALANNIKITNLDKPLKVICSEGDRLCASQCSKVIARELKGSIYIHPTAGHDLPIDEPEWLAGLFK